MRSADVVTNYTCNQACLFCRVRRAVDAPEFVAGRAVAGRISLAVRSGAERVVLTGGEPALRRDLPQLVAAARKLGAKEVWLETNATLIDPQRARALRDAGLDAVRVQLSGADASLDAVTRDDGGYSAALRGLQVLAASGLPLEVCAVLSRSTLAGIPGLPSLLTGIAPEARCLWLATPLLERGDPELPDGDALLSCVAATRQSGRDAGVDVKLEPRGAPPPCVFPAASQVSSLFALSPGRRDEPGFSRIDACSGCMVADRCPGWSAVHLILFDPSSVHPVVDDQLRRRLTLISTVSEQVQRELVEPGVYRDDAGASWDEAIVRVNFRCNQRCRFCFVSTHLPDPDVAVVCAAIESAAARGARIVLSGGEPTLHPSLQALVETAVRTSRHPVQIQTNAIRCAEGRLADDLASWGVKEAFVSLHGACGSVSDAITGAPGTFDKTMAGVDRLVAAGLGLTLNFVLYRSNLGELDPWVRLAASRWPTARLNLSFVAPATDLVPLDQETVPRYSEVLPAVEKAAKTADELGMVLEGFESMCGLPLCLVPADLVPRLQLSRIPPGFDRGEFLKAPVCAPCSLSDRCYGIRRRYAELYGVGELTAGDR